VCPCSCVRALRACVRFCPSRLHRLLILAQQFDEETRSQDSGQGLRTVETHVNIQNSLGKQQSQHAGDGTGDASEMRLPNVKDPKSAEIIEEPSDLRAFDKRCFRCLPVRFMGCLRRTVWEFLLLTTRL